jgi:hypothetical protein
MVTRLFEKEGVTAIRELERKKRSQIHAKEEEMKETVGARYRDIIESADSIASMQQHCRKIMESVESMTNYCTRLQGAVQTSSNRSSNMVEGEDEQTDLGRLVSVGTKVKFILDTPSHIFACLDGERMLDATIRYHSAKAVYHGLRDDQLSLFPWLEAHWEEVQSIPADIGSGCRRCLAEVGQTSKDYAESLVALMLLEKLSADNAVDLLVEASTQWVQQSLAALCSLESAPTSEALADGVKQLSTAMASAMCIFYTVFIALSVPEAGNAADTIDAGRTLLGRLLMDAVTAGITKADMLAKSSSLSMDQVHLKFAAWVASLKTLVSSSDSWLQHATRVSELHSLSHAVAVGIDIAVESTQAKASWQQVWESMLGLGASGGHMWIAVLRPSFISRAETIVAGALDCAAFHGEHVDPWLAQLRKEYSEGEFCDIGRDLWARQRTVVSNADGLNALNPKERAGTRHGALAHTGNLENICAAFSNRLKAAWDDCVLCDNHTAEGDVSSVLPDMRPLLWQLCCAAVESWMETIGVAVDELRVEAASIDFAPSQAPCDGILRQFACLRVAVALSQLTGSVADLLIASCILEGDHVNESDQERLKQQIQTQSLAAMEVWATALVRGSATTLRNSDNTASEAMHAVQRRGWQEISLINGSLEAGVDTLVDDDEVFQLPGSCSPAIYQFFFALCRELHRAGSYFVDRVVLEMLRHRASDAVAEVLQEAARAVCAQHGDKEGRVLQLLFDTRFSVAVLRDDSDDMTVSLRSPLPLLDSCLNTNDTIHPLQGLVTMEDVQTNLVAELDPVDW